jgi:hypothetical protein
MALILDRHVPVIPPLRWGEKGLIRNSQGLNSAQPERRRGASWRWAVGAREHAGQGAARPGRALQVEWRVVGVCPRSGEGRVWLQGLTRPPCPRPRPQGAGPRREDAGAGGDAAGRTQPAVLRARQQLCDGAGGGSQGGEGLGRGVAGPGVRGGRGHARTAGACTTLEGGALLLCCGTHASGPPAHIPQPSALHPTPPHPTPPHPRPTPPLLTPR